MTIIEITCILLLDRVNGKYCSFFERILFIEDLVNIYLELQQSLRFISIKYIAY